MGIRDVMEIEGYVCDHKAYIDITLFRTLDKRVLMIESLAHMGRVVRILSKEGLDISLLYQLYITTGYSSAWSRSAKARGLASYIKAYKCKYKSIPAFLEACYLTGINGDYIYIPDLIGSTEGVTEELIDKAEELSERVLLEINNKYVDDKIEELELRMKTLKLNIDTSLLQFLEALRSKHET
jgi:hypothetical protein